MRDLCILSGDVKIAEVTGGILLPLRPELLPFYLRRTGDVAAWLESRAIDSHRTNSRLLKRALRLAGTDDLTVVLSVNAVTITDNYWVKPMEDEHICYKDVRFQTNRFDALALSGDVNSFGQPPDKTPELTNTGSFEKCWRREGGVWWMVKAGKEEELFSELLAYRIGKLLGFPMAEYTEAGGYIKSRDFTSDAKVNFEPAAGLIGTEADYIKIYELLREADESLARQYISMCYFDALIYNMDRHENNFGVIRDGGTGGILSLAPLYDHNIALISRGYPRRAPSGGDILISDFAGLLRYAGKPFSVKELKEEEILEEAERIPFNPPITAEISEPKKFAAGYISRREKALEESCGGMLSYNGGAGT